MLERPKKANPYDVKDSDLEDLDLLEIKEEDFSHIEEALKLYPEENDIMSIAEKLFPDETELSLRISFLEEASAYFSYLNDVARIKNENDRRIQKTEEIMRAGGWSKYLKLEKEKEKEKKILILKKYKENLTTEFIEKVKENKKNKIPSLKLDNMSYLVGIAATELAEMYFKEISKKPSKREFDSIKEDIKKYFYENKKSDYAVNPEIVAKARDRYEPKKDTIYDEDYNINRIDHSL